MCTADYVVNVHGITSRFTRQIKKTLPLKHPNQKGY
jgi:hypothetical protein